MEFDVSIDLEVYRFPPGVFKENECKIFDIGMAIERHGKGIEVEKAHLWLIGASSHTPLAIFGDSDSVGGFGETKVLDEFDTRLVS